MGQRRLWRTEQGLFEKFIMLKSPSYEEDERKKERTENRKTKLLSGRETRLIEANNPSTKTDCPSTHT
jgi:hypothetical protein